MSVGLVAWIKTMTTLIHGQAKRDAGSGNPSNVTEGC